MKKKISVLTLALSCLRLAGCAKTVSKDEAVKAAGEFKVADVKDKFVGSSETTTDTRKSEVCLLGVKTSKDPKKDTAKKDNLDPTAFLVSSATISAASSDGVFKLNGKAISYSYSIKDEELAKSIKADALYTSFKGEIKYEFSYNADGLLIKEHTYTKYEGKKDDNTYINREVDVFVNYTWKKK